MQKSEAIKRLGGSIGAAARAVGVTYQAVNQWPEHLSLAVQDRVFAAYVRIHPLDWSRRWPALRARLPAIDDQTKEVST